MTVPRTATSAWPLADIPVARDGPAATSIELSSTVNRPSSDPLSEKYPIANPPDASATVVGE
jgi:hypothetical protein